VTLGTSTERESHAIRPDAGDAEGVTIEQKEALIQGVTDLLVQVLNKKPAQTFVVIEEIETDNWGIARMTVTKFR